MKPRPLVLLQFILLFSSVTGQSTLKTKYIDEIIIAVCDIGSDIQVQLDKGYRGFIIDEHSVTDDIYIPAIASFLSENPDEILCFIQKGNNHYKGDKLFSTFIEYIIDVNVQSLPQLDSLLVSKKNILFFSDNNDELKLWTEEYLLEAKVGNYYPIYTEELFRDHNPTNIFSILEYGPSYETEYPDSSFKNTDLPAAAINYIKRTGKIPNLIRTSNVSDVKQILSKMPLYVKTLFSTADNELLQGVRIKGYKDLFANGITHLLCYDVHPDNNNFFTENIELTFEKNGYRFVPEVFTFNYNNFNLFKQIKGQRIDIRTDLRYVFPLKKNTLTHEAFPIPIVNSSVKFSKDKHEKFAAVFDGKSDGIFTDYASDSEIGSNFSLFLWAKPEAVEKNHPFFSHPGSYCFKIRKGKLCYTIVSKVDIISKASGVEPGVWQHFGIVYEKGQTVSFYINGTRTEMIPAFENPQSESGYSIGTDQWDEYFQGSISDIHLWNRALGEEEVADIYRYGVQYDQGNNIFRSPWLWIIVGVLILIPFVIRWYLNMKRGKVRQTSENIPILVNGDIEFKHMVRYFGEFAIFDENGENLANKMSSKKRSLLIVVLYHTLKSEGISPQKLADTFWPGYNPQRAKNVRGTYIQDIRSIFNEDQLAINYENAYWSIKLHPDFQCDLTNLIAIENSFAHFRRENKEIEPNYIRCYVNIVKTGKFIDDLSNEFIDPIKEEVNDRVMENLEEFSVMCKENSDKDLLLNILSTILKIDPVHEEAFRQKMEILIKSEDKHRAQKTFDKFSVAWDSFFGEPSELKFDDFVPKK